MEGEAAIDRRFPTGRQLRRTPVKAPLKKQEKLYSTSALGPKAVLNKKQEIPPRELPKENQMPYDVSSMAPFASGRQLKRTPVQSAETDVPSDRRFPVGKQLKRTPIVVSHSTRGEKAANKNSAVLPEEREPEPTATIADRRFPTGKQLKRTPVIVGDSREEETDNNDAVADRRFPTGKQLKRTPIVSSQSTAEWETREEIEQDEQSNLSKGQQLRCTHVPLPNTGGEPSIDILTPLHNASTTAKHPLAQHQSSAYQDRHPKTNSNRPFATPQERVLNNNTNRERSSNDSDEDTLKKAMALELKLKKAMEMSAKRKDVIKNVIPKGRQLRRTPPTTNENETSHEPTIGKVGEERNYHDGVDKIACKDDVLEQKRAHIRRMRQDSKRTTESTVRQTSNKNHVRDHEKELAFESDSVPDQNDLFATPEGTFYPSPCVITPVEDRRLQVEDEEDANLSIVPLDLGDDALEANVNDQLFMDDQEDEEDENVRPVHHHNIGEVPILTKEDEAYMLLLKQQQYQKELEEELTKITNQIERCVQEEEQLEFKAEKLDEDFASMHKEFRRLVQEAEGCGLQVEVEGTEAEFADHKFINIIQEQHKTLRGHLLSKQTLLQRKEISVGGAPKAEELHSKLQLQHSEAKLLEERLRLEQEELSLIRSSYEQKRSALDRQQEDELKAFSQRLSSLQRTYDVYQRQLSSGDGEGGEGQLRLQILIHRIHLYIVRCHNIQHLWHE